jgi:hypothetical protein
MNKEDLQYDLEDPLFECGFWVGVRTGLEDV